MRLSDAIRLGALLRPQAFNSFKGAGSCVLRAAAEAVGIEDTRDSVLNYAELWSRFPLLQQRSPWCPACDCGEPELMSLLYHLNDRHRWTRGRIADWVATLEPAETTTAQTTTARPRGSKSDGDTTS